MRAPSAPALGAVLALVGVSLLLFAPLFDAIPAAHDLPDHVAMATAYRDGLRSGDVLPRWYADFNQGWGEPTGVFYPPGLAAATAAVSLVSGCGIVTALFVVLWACTLAGGAGVYALARELSGRGAAVAAAVLFVLLPYRAFELYGGGLLSAYAAGCVVPWGLFALSRVARTGRGGPRAADLAWAASFCLIALLNLPAALLFAYLTGAWGVAAVLTSRRWRGVARVALGGAGGAALAAVYLIPMVCEMEAVVVPHADETPWYLSNFVFQGESSWMDPALRVLFDRMALAPAVLLAAGALGACWIAIARTPRTAQGVRLRLLVVFGVGGFLLATPLSRPLWDTLPFLHRVNLPWRLLDIVCAPSVVLVFFALERALSREARWWRACRWGLLAPGGAMAVAVLALDLSILAMNGDLPAGGPESLAGLYSERQGYFLPVGAVPPARLRGHPAVRVLTPGTRVAAVAWSPARRVLRVESEAPCRFVARTYWFPGWTAARRGAASAGDDARVVPDPDTGGLLVEGPPGEYDVELRFGATPSRRIGAAVSLLALLALLGSAAMRILSPYAFRAQKTTFQASDRTRGRRVITESAARNGHHHQSDPGVSERIRFQ